MFTLKSAGKPQKYKLITAGVMALVIIMLVIARQYPGFIEHYYSEGLYPVVCVVLHSLFNIIPFSAGDVIYIATVIYLIYAFFNCLRLLFTRRFKALAGFLLKLLLGFEVAYLMFYLFWGLNYFRPAAAERLGLTDTSYTVADARALTAMLIDSANSLRFQLDTADRQQSNLTSYQTAVEAVAGLSRVSPQYKSYAPRIKPSLLSSLMNYMGTSGYYNPFTSESQINYQMPAFDIPFVACHELSHQIGFAREDEANFVGFIAGVSSKNRLLKYSAYYTGVEEFMRFLRRRDTLAHHQLRLKISAAVIQDFKVDSAYWTKYEGNTEMVSGLFYDRFLKANNQPHGLHTYNRMIKLTMAWYGKKGNTVKK